MQISNELHKKSKDDDLFDFMEKNVTDVWKEIGIIKAKLNENDQSSFTNLNSLTNELKQNKEEKQTSDLDLPKNKSS